MAANSFEDVLNSLVTDDSDKTALSGLVDKYPGIKDGWLRQSDYSRKLDTVRESEKKLKDWYDENWDEAAGIPKMEKYWREKATELEGKVGQDMTFDEIQKFTEKTLTEKGVVLKTDLDATLKTKTEEFNNGFLGNMYQNALLIEKQGEHMHEFHKPLKVRDLFAKMQEFGKEDPRYLNDIEASYDKYVAEDRKAKADADGKEREARIRKEAKAEAEKEFLEKTVNHGGMPVDQDDPGLGHLQQKMMLVKDPDALKNAELGKNTLAHIAAQEYRKGTFGAAKADTD